MLEILPQQQISTVVNLCVAQSPEVAVELLGAGVDEPLHARVGHAAAADERVARAAAVGGGRGGDGGAAAAVLVELLPEPGHLLRLLLDVRPVLLDLCKTKQFGCEGMKVGEPL